MGVFGMNLVAPRRDLIMGCCECGTEIPGVYVTGNLFNTRTTNEEGRNVIELIVNECFKFYHCFDLTSHCFE
jgi:hypothetical protein